MAVHRLAVEGHIGSDAVINVLHVQSSVLSAQAIGEAWRDSMHSLYLACISSAYESRQVTVTDLSTLDQAVVALSGLGSIVSESTPPQCAGIVSWRTAKIGRAYRGRTYMPCVPENQQANGTITAGLKTLYGDFADAWTSIILSYAMHPVIYHRASALYDTVTSYVIRDTVYTCRRRTLGRGA